MDRCIRTFVITGTTMAMMMMAMCAGASAADQSDQRGTTACGIFVSTSSGNDHAGCGLTSGDPCATINYGIARAVNENLTCLFVQAGIYDEVVEMASGVHIQGGFNMRWQHDSYTFPAHAVRIRGGLHAGSSQYMTIRAVNISAPTRITNLIIQGPHVPRNETGKSSYAVYASDSDRLALHNVQIEAGDGAPGLNGEPGTDGPPVTSQMHGGSGGNGAHITTTCDSTSRGQGGMRGGNPCAGGSADGGMGGTAARLTAAVRSISLQPPACRARRGPGQAAAQAAWAEHCVDPANSAARERRAPMERQEAAGLAGRSSMGGGGERTVAQAVMESMAAAAAAAGEPAGAIQARTPTAPAAVAAVRADAKAPAASAEWLEADRSACSR